MEKEVKVGTEVIHFNIGHMSCFLTGIILHFICHMHWLCRKKGERDWPKFCIHSS